MLSYKPHKVCNYSCLPEIDDSSEVYFSTKKINLLLARLFISSDKNICVFIIALMADCIPNFAENGEILVWQ